MSMRVTPASSAAWTTASASVGDGRSSFVDRGMAPSPIAPTSTRPTVSFPMLRFRTEGVLPRG